MSNSGSLRQQGQSELFFLPAYQQRNPEFKIFEISFASHEVNKDNPQKTAELINAFLGQDKLKGFESSFHVLLNKEYKCVLSLP